MKILQVNATYGIGSTGKIVSDLQKTIEKFGHESFVLCGTAHFSSKSKNSNTIFCLSKNENYFRNSILKSRVTGRMGYDCKQKTLNAIKWIESIHPDVIHLHNIHGNYLNVKILFDFIKERKIPVVWTLHDCWAFTGRCSCFESIQCEKWKTQCQKCKLKDVYPISYFFDFSKSMHQDKKKWFSGVDKMILVTPSQWLADYVSSSFLGTYDLIVINNGIDTNIYRRYDILQNELHNSTKDIILGVASSWMKSKGLDDFIELDKMIDHEKYQIKLVGLNQRQLNSLPATILGQSRTNNEDELVKIYNEAKAFVNPTYLDNYPTTNLEAQSCGVPLITYRTGGSPESALDPNLVVPQGQIHEIYEKILSLHMTEDDSQSLSSYAKKLFDKNRAFAKYVQVYEDLKSK